MQKLLPIENYKVSRAQKRMRLNNLDRFKQNLLEVAPEFSDSIIDGYQIIGKTAKFQQYIATKDKTYFAINISKKAGAGASVKIEKKEEGEMNLDTIKLDDVVYDPAMFVPIKSNTALDYCFSIKGGIMPATNYIVVGDPGIGKSSLSIQFAADILKQNPNKKVLFISAEMTKWDMHPYLERFPLWGQLNTFFVSTMTESLYKESIEAKFNEGWDLVVIDSFAELAESVKGDYNDTVSGANKKTYNDIEKWLIDLMVIQNGAENALNLHTSFISIQQVTKGGTFVGSNKLKHNTTGMIELRFSKGDERKIHVDKNRRGNKYQDLIFDFSEDTSEPITYDVARIERDNKIKEEIKKVRDSQLVDEANTDKWLQDMIDAGETFDDEIE